MEIKNAKHQLLVEDANLSGSTFENVDLSASVFTDINLSNATFSDANLSGVDFMDCNVKGVRMNGVLMTDALKALEDSAPTSVQEVLAKELRIHIRPFAESDQTEVIALWKDVFAYSAPHNDPLTAIRQKLKVGRNLFGVAVLGGQVVGTILGGYDGHRGWIYSLAVHPQHRRRGIASALVKWAEAGLIDRGCMKVNLQLMASNIATTAFYENLGYKVEERISMGKLL